MGETSIDVCVMCGEYFHQVGGKGHRKKVYCKDRCRQRACRAKRERGKHPLDIIDQQNEILRLEIKILTRRLEASEREVVEKEAEIVRLNLLLEYQAKKKR